MRRLGVLVLIVVGSLWLLSWVLGTPPVEPVAELPRPSGSPQDRAALRELPSSRALAPSPALAEVADSAPVATSSQVQRVAARSPARVEAGALPPLPRANNLWSSGLDALVRPHLRQPHRGWDARLRYRRPLRSWRVGFGTRVVRRAES
mgnify:CR=1 FL=1